MTWLAPRLRERAQILVAVQVPNDDGGFDRGYRRLGTVWAELKQASYQAVVTAPVRGVNEGDVPSHEVVMRHGSVSLINSPAFALGEFDEELHADPGGLGREFARDFGLGFDSITDLCPIKARWFVMVLRGSKIRGRLFRIVGVADPTERREFLHLRVREIEERGTGYQL